MRKLTEEECHRRLEGRPLRMVKYGGSSKKNKSRFQCLVCDYTWNSVFHNIHTGGNGCPKCAGVVKVTEDEVRKRLEKRSIVLVFYAGTTQSRESIFECSVCNSTWITAFSDINAGYGCPKCGILKSAKSKHVPEKVIHEKLKDRPFKMVSYSGLMRSNDSVFRCSVCANLWKASVSNVCGGTGCPICNAPCKPRLSREESLNRLSGRGISIIHYGGTCTSTKSIFECSVCKYNWHSSIDRVGRGGGCPNCAKSGFNPCKPAWLYVLLLDTSFGPCYGFGITNNIIRRINKHKNMLKLALDYEYPQFTLTVELRLKR